MKKQELSNLVLKSVTAIAFKDSHSECAFLGHKFRADLGFEQQECDKLNFRLAREITRRSGEYLDPEDLEMFWLDYDATVQEFVDYIAEKISINS